MTDIPDELVERMVMLVRTMAAYSGAPYYAPDCAQFCNEAARMEKHLPKPLDPDMIEARNIAAARYPGTATAAAILAGEFDTLYVEAVYDAIKRGRELERGK